MKRYIEPVAEIVVFGLEDVITTSGTDLPVYNPFGSNNSGSATDAEW